MPARALVLPSFAEGLARRVHGSSGLGPTGHQHLYRWASGAESSTGVNGWLVPAGAVEPLVDAMAEALTADSSELEQMGRNGAAEGCQSARCSCSGRKTRNLFSISETGSNRHHQDDSSARTSSMAVVADSL